MKLRKFNIDLDTKLKKSNPGIEVVQGDNISNILEINLFQDDEPYLLDNLTILTVFNKSDNTTVIQSSEDPELPILIKDNKATITLKSNSISASGLVVAEVSIYGGNDERLTSQRFTFYVRESLLSDDVIESTNEFPVLVSLIKDVRGLLEKQIEMVESETIRVSNEVERIKTHEKLLILQSNLETLQISLENTEEQRQINESARENLKTSLESLQGDLLALEIEIANSIDIANQSAINADDKANLAQTATDNINTKLIEANNLIDEIVTDEQERILAENERISNENERIENEGIRDTEFTNKINDFVAETERVESEYPLRLTDVENSHTALKEEYANQTVKITNLSNLDDGTLIASNYTNTISVVLDEPLKISHKYYTSAVRSKIQELPTAGVMGRITHIHSGTILLDMGLGSNSKISTVINQSENRDLTFYGSSGTNSGNILFENIMIIDLTKVFGVGNEPSKEFMDDFIKDINGNYFKGELAKSYLKIVNTMLNELKKEIDNNKVNIADLDTGEVMEILGLKQEGGFLTIIYGEVL